MSDLVAFLRARLDEDEQSAREALPVLVTSRGTVMWPDYGTFSSPALDVATAYLERFQPARVLREVEADRKLIERYDACVKKYNEHGGIYPCGNDDLSESIWEYEEYVFPLRATRFADHPDYREEWRP